MSGSTIGTILKLTTFGESHGSAIGGVLEGCPAGLAVDFEYVQAELNRRRPGQSALVSPRNEADQLEWLSGVKNGITLGTPIGFIVRNNDQRSSDYDAIRKVYRPSHSDYVYEAKYGLRDENGGGRSSARETISRVVGGALAQLLLKHWGISIAAYTAQIGPHQMPSTPDGVPIHYPLETIDASLVRCPDPAVSQRIENYLGELQEQGDTAGGSIVVNIKGAPAGLGEPVFDQLQADLAKAMLSINATKGFEYGTGFSAASYLGSAHNDEFVRKGQQIGTKTNRSGGIQGGISNGEDIYFKVAFKPVSTIRKQQQSLSSDTHETVVFNTQGRHDPCVVPRAVPIVQAMTALVIADHYLRNKNSTI